MPASLTAFRRRGPAPLDAGVEPLEIRRTHPIFTGCP